MPSLLKSFRKHPFLLMIRTRRELNIAGLDQHGLSGRQDFVRSQKRKRLGRLLKLFAVVVVFGLAVYLILTVPTLISKLRKPFQNIPSNIVNQNNLNLEFRTNLLLGVLKGNSLKELALVSLEKERKSVSFLTLEPETKVYLGSQIASFNDLLTLKNKSLSLDPLLAALVEDLGYPIDGYLITVDGGSWVNQKGIEALGDKSYTLEFFLNLWQTKEYLNTNLRTNLSIGDLFNLTNFLKQLKPDTIAYHDFKKARDSGGLLNMEEIDSRLGISLADQIITQEGAAVEVVNASRVEGMEIIFKRLLGNLGANVLQVSVSGEEDTSRLLSIDKKNNLSLRLEQILNVEAKRVDKASDTADVKVVIGNDFAKYFDF